MWLVSVHVPKLILVPIGKEFVPHQHRIWDHCCDHFKCHFVQVLDPVRENHHNCHWSTTTDNNQQKLNQIESWDEIEKNLNLGYDIFCKNFLQFRHEIKEQKVDFLVRRLYLSIDILNKLRVQRQGRCLTLQSIINDFFYLGQEINIIVIQIVTQNSRKEIGTLLRDSQSIARVEPDFIVKV